ncbi:MAG: anthranilate synthase component I [Ignavibacteriales bacterium]|nr:MAG: anthranilate synthase component I [Ignavibacteriales bacterium]
MTLEEFKRLAKEYNFIPVYEKVTADLLTPVLAYLRLRKTNSQCFLLESVEAKESLGRYSFIGINPVQSFQNKGLKLTINVKGKKSEIEQDIFQFLKTEMSKRKHPNLPELPSFTGGIVGYLGYENIALIENVLSFETDHDEIPDSIFGIYDTIIAFDHYKHQMILITNVEITGTSDSDINKAFHSAKSILKEIKTKLKEPITIQSDFKSESDVKENLSDETFHELVELSKKNILEGDIFQIVLSKRFSAKYTGDLFNVYRALRIINPSPYMYFLEFENQFTIIGTSPENLVKVKDRIAEVLPIAGTRRRGNSKEEDIALEENLLNDPKEQAEHVMLVDLGRNDLGRVCKYDTIKVVEQMKVHRFSHVMHLVSKVQGKLDNDKDCIDTLKACFPAGTVTGAPKIRAIQLIKDYEKLNRNVYAGAVGYIDFSGNLDMCIAIRTLFAIGDKLIWQAGAGIVADSIPKLESKEIKNKSAVLKQALEYAEVIDEDFGN